MKTYSLLIVLWLAISANLFSQTTLYHNLRETRTQPFLKSWDVGKENTGELYVVEKTDSLNRVIELRIYKGKDLYPLSCKITPIIKYEYKGNMIIAHRYELENQYVTNVRCGNGQKTIYYIENGTIAKSIDFIVDFDAFKPDENSSVFYKKYFNENFKIYEKGIKADWKEIVGYGYSLKKMNGVNPKK